MKKSMRIPLNLQYFAETPPDSKPDAKPNGTPDSKPDATPDKKPGEGAEDQKELTEKEQIAELMLANAKLKLASDKASGEASDYKKKLKAKMSEEEIATEEKALKEAKRDEEFQSLLKENTVTKLEKNFIGLGYPGDLATKAASAQYDGETEELFKYQQQFNDIREKQLEEKFFKQNPGVHAGNGDGENGKDAFEKGFDSYKY